jgi:hypothetical protein
MPTPRTRKPKRRSGPAFPVVEIDTWRRFQSVVAGPRYRNWAFRGQQDARWPLNSSLSRYLQDFKVHPDAWVEQEERIVRIFRRKAHLFLEHVPDDGDAFQWLALMQHHGAPTRLVDFTWSPYVAAFFALERATVDAAVWALDPPELKRPGLKLPGRKETIDPRELNLREPGNYEAYYLKNEIPFVRTGEPYVMNKRLIAQSGTFVVPGLLQMPIEKILSAYPRAEKTITKFVLRTERLRDEAMEALYNMNLTPATLFPDLDGLARSMAYELEFNWAFDTKTMKANRGYRV